MRPRNKPTISALAGGLVGLGWIAVVHAIDLKWYGQSAGGFDSLADLPTGGEQTVRATGADAASAAPRRV